VRDLIDELSPGTIDVGNVVGAGVALAALVLYTQGMITVDTMLLLIGGGLGSDALIKAGKKGKPPTQA